MTEKTIGVHKSLWSTFTLHPCTVQLNGKIKTRGGSGSPHVEKVQDVSIEELREAAVH